MPKFVRHLFVCINRREAGHPRGCCSDKDSQALADAFKASLAARGLKAEVRANKSQCLDQCEHGPTVVVYPDAVWYGFVQLSDVDEIVDSHIVGNVPVARLVLADACINTFRCPHRDG